MKKSLGAETLLYPTPVWVIGSYDKDGRANVMTASWAGICCSGPAAVTVSVRKQRYTYENITSRGAFTVNIPSEKYVKEVDYIGMASGRKTDKFADCGLTPVKSELVDAPFIEEFPVVVECKLIHTLDVGVHTMFVGEILDVKCEEEAIDSSGGADVEKIKTYAFSPMSGKYYRGGTFLADGFSAGKDIKK